jgi:hypothetical protein
MSIEGQISAPLVDCLIRTLFPGKPKRMLPGRQYACHFCQIELINSPKASQFWTIFHLFAVMRKIDNVGNSL